MTIILFVLILSLLVLVHELGHFVAARRNGVKVDEFGVGFPPRMFSKKYGDTTYSVNWIPLGGFVKIKGEAGESAGDPDSFAGKKLWQRSVVIAAGVIMNFVTAWFLISLTLAIGIPIPLEGADLPASARVKNVSIQVASILPDSPADRAKIQPGDTIVAINGTSFQEIEQLQNFVASANNTELEINLKRGDQSITVKAKPELLTAVKRAAIGVGLVKTGVATFPWYLAPIEGLSKTVSIGWQILLAFGDLFKNLIFGRSVSADVSGPIGIAVLTGQVAKLGLVYVLQFMALLSLNLAIINFLPFPALDGGRMLFIVIESLRGRAVSKKVEAVIHNVGFAILITLMILVTARDIGKYGEAFFSGFKNLF